MCIFSYVYIYICAYVHIVPFVTGHVPVQRIRKWIEVEEDFGCLKSFRKGNLIDIDGGCSFGEIDEVDNGLIFLRLEDMVEFPVPYVG